MYCKGKRNFIFRIDIDLIDFQREINVWISKNTDLKYLLFFFPPLDTLFYFYLF